MGQKVSAEATSKDIRRQTRRQHNAEEKIRIVLEGLRGEETIAELCRREGIAQRLILPRAYPTGLESHLRENIKKATHF